MDDGRSHAVGGHDGLVLVVVVKELLSNAPESVLGLNNVLGVAEVRNRNGFALVGTTREPRQGLDTRQPVQVNSMVDTRRTRDFGVAIRGVLMQGNLVRVSCGLDRLPLVDPAVRSPMSNPQGIEDEFEVTVLSAPTVIARVLTDALHAPLPKPSHIDLDELPLLCVGHAIGKLFGVKVIDTGLHARLIKKRKGQGDFQGG